MTWQQCFPSSSVRWVCLVRTIGLIKPTMGMHHQHREYSNCTCYISPHSSKAMYQSPWVSAFTLGGGRMEGAGGGEGRRMEVYKQIKAKTNVASYILTTHSQGTVVVDR